MYTLFAILSGMWLVVDKVGATDIIAEGLWLLQQQLTNLQAKQETNPETPNAVNE